MAESPEESCSAKCFLALCCFLVAVAVLKYTGLGKKISEVWFAMLMNHLSPKYNKGVALYKSELFQNLESNGKEEMTILEIGCGPGGNLHLYPKDIPVKLIAVEPNVYHKKYLEENLKKYENVSLQKFVISRAEDMKDIESNSVEIVISTIVLCSVDNQSEVLREVKRVLKPGGVFYFMEHVAAEEGSWVYRFQAFFNYVWIALCDGCHLTRCTGKAIESAGFTDVNIKSFSADKLGMHFFVVWPHVNGYAVK